MLRWPGEREMTGALTCDEGRSVRVRRKNLSQVQKDRAAAG